MTLLSILPLGVLIVIFLAMLTLRFKSVKRASLYLSLSGLALASYCVLSFDVYKIIIPPEHHETFLLAFQTLWWVALGYVINAILKHGFYDRTLNVDGVSTIPRLIQHLISILIYMVILMIVLRFVFDQSITALATASGAVALLLGYSSRSVLDELFSGLALFANEPFEKGDLIQVNNEWYYVIDVNWRAITFLDMDQNHVEVPNTIVATSKIRNLDRPSKMTRRTMYFLAEYNAPPKVIIGEVEAAMKDCPHIMPHPWNFVSVYDFDKTGIQYKMHFHVDHYDNWYVASDELVNAMWYRFSRKGIRFAHQRHLNFKNPEDETKGLYKSAYDKDAWADLMDQFSHVPIFEGMTDADTEELIKSAPFYIMGPPEILTHAGAEHSSMFLIVSGAVDLYAVDKKGQETWMTDAGPNDQVGIMALLTGSPQGTTVRVREETVICEITSEAMHELFERRPAIMDKVAKSVALWQQEEAEALSVIAENKKNGATQIKANTVSLSKLIKKFFNMREE